MTNELGRTVCKHDFPTDKVCPICPQRISGWIGYWFTEAGNRQLTKGLWATKELCQEYNSNCEGFVFVSGSEDSPTDVN